MNWETLTTLDLSGGAVSAKRGLHSTHEDVKAVASQSSRLVWKETDQGLRPRFTLKVFNAFANHVRNEKGVGGNGGSSSIATADSFPGGN